MPNCNVSLKTFNQIYTRPLTDACFMKVVDVLKSLKHKSSLRLSEGLRDGILFIPKFSLAEFWENNFWIYLEY